MTSRANHQAAIIRRNESALEWINDPEIGISTRAYSRSGVRSAISRATRKLSAIAEEQGTTVQELLTTYDNSAEGRQAAMNRKSRIEMMRKLTGADEKGC